MGTSTLLRALRAELGPGEAQGWGLLAFERYDFKQWGGRTPKTGGRLLGLRTWDEYPTAMTRESPLDGH